MRPESACNLGGPQPMKKICNEWMALLTINGLYGKGAIHFNLSKIAMFRVIMNGLPTKHSSRIFSPDAKD